MKKLLLTVFTFAFLSFSLSSNAQDYLITFAGTGASTTVSTVEVENLTSGKIKTLNEGDILHLTSVVGISQLEDNKSSMRIYPNPMMDNSIIALHPPEAGDAVITIYEMTGKNVAQIHTYLENYWQEFRLSGLNNGMYLINVSGNTFQFSGKILSSGHRDGNPGIEKVSNTAESNIEKISKREFNVTQGMVDMQYNPGERLIFKANSGIYSTFKTVIPTEDKTLTFNFVPCTDGDNNNYSVVEIGEQIWMAENLSVTKYNDNTPIPYVTDDSVWSNLFTPAYCWYGNDESTYKDTYGALYNWYTVYTGKLCPAGWHVPYDVEWTQLTDFLGGLDFVGGKLKEVDTTYWNSPNTGATNETGFNALPAGFRYFFGTFAHVRNLTYWWSFTEKSTSNAWSRGVFSSYSYVDRFDNIKLYGLSVRCIKNTELTILLPTLTTNLISSITSNTAISGGNVLNDGGSMVTVGVCWSTTTNPTIANNITSDGSATGVFTSLITGLTSSTKYYVRAYATNSIGTAYGNELEFTTATETIPDAPTIDTAIAGNEQATITFIPPDNDGGSAIKVYTVTSSPGGVTGTGSKSPITVTGLINGTSYTFTVKATNDIGTGPSSLASNPVTPATIPGAPTIVTATAGNAQVTVTFTPPDSDGGSEITEYTVTSSPSWIKSTGSTSPIIVTGLTNGTSYSFTVNATNDIGTGPSSLASNSVTPATVPDAPTIGTVHGGNDHAIVRITAPDYNGGSVITGYVVTSNPGGFTGTGSASPITVTELTNGTAYSFTVTAINAMGISPPSSASISITPSLNLAIGNSYQGGIIAYFLQEGDSGYIAGETHGLIAAINDQSAGAQWGCHDIDITGADGTAIGTGSQNTIDIITECTSESIAAKLCYDFVSESYSDWYLPSRDELNKLYLSKSLVGGFSTYGYYWSSSEYYFYGPWYQHFYAGSLYYGGAKFAELYVRAIRSF